MEMSIKVLIIVCILMVINITSFIVVGVDKHKARRRQWRIAERTFFWLAVFGGCPGIYIGMLVFRHKTRHWYFMYGIPTVFLLQILILFFLKKLL